MSTSTNRPISPLAAMAMNRGAARPAQAAAPAEPAAAAATPASTAAHAGDVDPSEVDVLAAVDLINQGQQSQATTAAVTTVAASEVVVVQQTQAAVVEAPPAATPAPQAPATALAAPQNERLHVLLSTGNARFDQILCGVVGKEDAQGRFVMDSDYSQLAYLFTLAASGKMPIVKDLPLEAVSDDDAPVEVKRGERTLVIEASPAAIKALKTNLVELGAANWNALYDSVAGMAPAAGLGASMIDAERAMVAGNVSRYLAAQGLPEWDVPIIYTAMCYQEDPADRPKTEVDLIKASSMNGQVMIDITREPTPHVAQVVAALTATPPAAAAAEQQGEQGGEGAAAQVATTATAEPDLPADWLAHQGSLSLTLEGTIKVRASSAAEAASVTGALMHVAQSIPGIARSMAPTPTSIQGATLNAPTQYDGDDDYDYDRDR